MLKNLKSLRSYINLPIPNFKILSEKQILNKIKLNDIKNFSKLKMQSKTNTEIPKSLLDKIKLIKLFDKIRVKVD